MGKLAVLWILSLLLTSARFESSEWDDSWEWDSDDDFDNGLESNNVEKGSNEDNNWESDRDSSDGGFRRGPKVIGNRIFANTDRGSPEGRRKIIFRGSDRESPERRRNIIYNSDSGWFSDSYEIDSDERGFSSRPTKDGSGSNDNRFGKDQTEGTNGNNDDSDNSFDDYWESDYDSDDGIPIQALKTALLRAARQFGDADGNSDWRSDESDNWGGDDSDDNRNWNGRQDGGKGEATIIIKKTGFEPDSDYSDRWDSDGSDDWGSSSENRNNNNNNNNGNNNDDNDNGGWSSNENDLWDSNGGVSVAEGRWFDDDSDGFDDDDRRSRIIRRLRGRSRVLSRDSDDNNRLPRGFRFLGREADDVGDDDKK